MKAVFLKDKLDSDHVIVQNLSWEQFCQVSIVHKKYAEEIQSTRTFVRNYLQNEI
jgi:hypothetical protein